MKLTKFLKGMTVTAATLGILLPYPTIANATENARANRQAETVRDVALGAGGVLRGQVVNKDGLPERDAAVSVLRDGATVATVKTNAEGQFVIAGISGGVCAITSGKATGVVRAWSHGTAPPAASPGVLLVPSDLTARGQDVLGVPLSRIGVGGLLVLGVVGTIIVLTVDDNDAS